MSSQKQIDANRRNSQHSTGPKTEVGKRISARNSFKHGLSANAFVVDGEDHELYAEALSDMIENYAAQDTDEMFLVEQILQSHMLAQRARHNLQEYFFVAIRGSNDKARYIENATVIVRYLVQHERSAMRANEMFYQNRKIRQAAVVPAPAPVQEAAEPAPPSTVSKENGFVPQKQKPGVRQLLKLTKPEPKPTPIA